MNRWVTRAIGLLVLANIVTLALFVLGFSSLANVSNDGRQNTQRLAHNTQQLATYARQTRQLANTTAHLVAAGRQQRIATSYETCQKVDELSNKLKALIIGGARASRPFDKIYRQFGFPRYRARVRTARHQAATLTLIDCRSLHPPTKPHK